MRIVYQSAFIADIARKMEEKRYVTPTFQRKTCWSTQDYLDLLDSMHTGMPIGTIILWYENDTSRHKMSIVDGQQRITALHKVYYLNEFYYDFISKTFNAYPTDSSIGLRKLLNLNTYFDFVKNNLDFDKDQLIVSQLDYVIDTFRSTQLGIISVNEATVDEVVDVYMRFNSKGIPVSDKDLTHALDTLKA